MRLLLLLVLVICACPSPHRPLPDEKLRHVRLRLYFESDGFARAQLYHPFLPFLREPGFAAAVYPEATISDSSFVRLKVVYQRRDTSDSLKLTRVTIHSGGDSLVFARERWEYGQLGVTPDGRTLETLEFRAEESELEGVLVQEPTTVTLRGAGGTREYKLEVEERFGWQDLLFYYRATQGIEPAE
jgi:hypothetical protein